MRELGRGVDTHPEEWASHIAHAQALGIEISYRPGAMAYSPGTRPGSPGQLIIDPDASISALRHETSHLADDQAAGWGGFRLVYDQQYLWASEFRAYLVEIRYARELKRFDLARKLIELPRARRTDIFGQE